MYPYPTGSVFRQSSVDDISTARPTSTHLPALGVLRLAAVEALCTALRQHAATAIACGLEAEAKDYLLRYARPGDAAVDYPLVVRNGFQPLRYFMTSVGPVEVRLPKMRLRAAQIPAFRSALVPRYQRCATLAKADALARYLLAWTRGKWPTLMAVLLGCKEHQVPQLPVASLDDGWCRDVPGCVRKSNLWGSWLGTQVRAVPLPSDCSSVGQGRAGGWLLAVVSQHKAQGWQLLACSEVPAPSLQLCTSLLSELKASGLVLRDVPQISLPTARYVHKSGLATLVPSACSRWATME